MTIEKPNFRNDWKLYCQLREGKKLNLSKIVPSEAIEKFMKTMRQFEECMADR